VWTVLRGSNNPTSGEIHRTVEGRVSKGYLHTVFTAASFTVAKGAAPRASTGGRWIRTRWAIHTTDYSALKRTDAGPPATARMSAEDAMLGEVSRHGRTHVYEAPRPIQTGSGWWARGAGGPVFQGRRKPGKVLHAPEPRT